MPVLWNMTKEDQAARAAGEASGPTEEAALHIPGKSSGIRDLNMCKQTHFGSSEQSLKVEACKDFTSLHEQDTVHWFTQAPG